MNSQPLAITRQIHQAGVRNLVDRDPGVERNLQDVDFTKATTSTGAGDGKAAGKKGDGDAQPQVLDAQAQVVNAPAEVRPVKNARAHVRSEQNARAKVRFLKNARAQMRREQNARVQVRPVQNTQAQTQPVQNAQPPWLLQSLGGHN
jgi:hypothetical protein